VDITPGVNETLGRMIDTIQDSILARIRHHHEQTQVAVNSKISDLRKKTTWAVDKHREAADTDIEYVQCMRNWVHCRGSHATCSDQLDDLKSSQNESCRESRAKRFYTSSDSVHMQSIPVLECDFAQPSSECKFDDFKAKLANWADSLIKPELDMNRSNYLRAHKICKHDRHETEKKKKECREIHENCVGRELSCKELEIQRDVLMCTFGDRVQRKCSSKASYDDLAANIRGNGSAWSDPDRRQEWMSAELIKCMLHDHRMGADFDQATMKGCMFLSNYSRDVGVMDLRMDDFRTLTSEENFDCIQTAVNFSGVEVVMTPGIPHPTYTFNTPHAPTVNLDLGTNAFGICSTSADSQFCGSNFNSGRPGCDGRPHRRNGHTR
jgi:hypothetical protein